MQLSSECEILKYYTPLVTLNLRLTIMHRITAASIHGNKKLIELFKNRLPKHTEYCALTTKSNLLPNDTLNTTFNEFNNDGLQRLAKLFPRREEFPARHIGPREQEQTQMLELLGFRVS
jgi:hypothetical protein